MDRSEFDITSVLRDTEINDQLSAVRVTTRYAGDGSLEMPGKPETTFVTGASRGIGKAISLSLAKLGFDVIVSARTVLPGTSG
ncbi:MAG: SDR family NAD(P)-dependent oxidoreductase [Novosphingobium sp.]|nr:SDR family NAD(P)-dependent oxidoreductase [Novosphingobium sp.]